MLIKASAVTILVVHLYRCFIHKPSNSEVHMGRGNPMASLQRQARQSLLRQLQGH